MYDSAVVVAGTEAIWLLLESEMSKALMPLALVTVHERAIWLEERADVLRTGA